MCLDYCWNKFEIDTWLSNWSAEKKNPVTVF